MMRKASSFVLLLILATGTRGGAQVCSTHTYLGNNPDEGNPGWHEEAQGLAHDADYWYMTQNPAFQISPFQTPPAIIGGGPRLWRVPVTTNLGSGVDCGHGGVSCGSLRDTALMAHGYNHYGDPDIYEVGGRGYLLVPLENGDQGPAVAIFRADASLEFLAFAPFPGQTHSSWVAVDANGLLLSSEFDGVTHFNRYYLDWAAFQATGEHAFTLVPVSPMKVQDEVGAPLTLEGAQGGEYSDDGGTIYFVSGHDGIHVFEPRAGSVAECGSVVPCTVASRIEQSHNSPGGFAYEFDTSSTVKEEPEGLTFWDLDADGRAPGLKGQLHVVLLDNDLVTDDDVYVKHYRRSDGDTVPPELACPVDIAAECSTHTGVAAASSQLSAFFAGAVASDACDPDPSVTHDAPTLFSRGATQVTFTARDRSTNTSSCVARVAVVDTVAPAVSCPAPAVVECTGPNGISASDLQLAPFFAGATATDVCDAAPSLSSNAAANLPLGTTPITFTSTDAAGNSRACGSAVTIADTVAPAVAVTLSTSELWPANHKMVPVRASFTASDRCDPNVVVTLVSVTSNEPDNGLGDGDTVHDIQGASPGTADTSFELRAERSGRGSGRVYTIVYRATDASGNASLVTSYVRVPHNR